MRATFQPHQGAAVPLVCALALLALAACAPSIEYFEPEPLVQQFRPKVDRTLRIYLSPKIVDSAPGVKDFRKSLKKGLENTFEGNVARIEFPESRPAAGLILEIEYFAAGASGSGMGAQFVLVDYRAALYDADFQIQAERREFRKPALHPGYQEATKYAVEQALQDLANVFFSDRNLRMIAK